MWQQIKNIYHLVRAFLASAYFHFPSKKVTVIGVTGTDGKTTTAHMIYGILKAAGKKASLISSVYATIGNQVYDTGFHVTTPDPVALQKFLKLIVGSGSEFLVLEVTSHGLDQNRVFGINFKVGVLTNITHEHLDYHNNYDNYLTAKAKLFRNVKYSILNADDASFAKIKRLVSGKIIAYSLKKSADINLNKFPLKLAIAGEYNLSNALAAAAAVSVLDVDKKIITKALSQFKGVVGRMENINLGQDFEVIVDFAHTPNALKQALATLRSKLKTKNPRLLRGFGGQAKLIAVFGAAGLRDSTKRPLMGEAAAKYADISVLTTEDPRTEKVEDICRQIASGLNKEGKKEDRDYYFVYDRSKAIQFAINLAQKDDIVATFGKSHEKSMCFGKKESPWDEFATVKKAIKKVMARNERKT